MANLIRNAFEAVTAKIKPTKREKDRMLANICAMTSERAKPAKMRVQGFVPAMAALTIVAVGAGGFGIWVHHNHNNGDDGMSAVHGEGTTHCTPTTTTFAVGGYDQHGNPIPTICLDSTGLPFTLFTYVTDGDIYVDIPLPTTYIFTTAPQSTLVVPGADDVTTTTATTMTTPSGQKITQQQAEQIAVARAVDFITVDLEPSRNTKLVTQNGVELYSIEISSTPTEDPFMRIYVNAESGEIVRELWLSSIGLQVFRPSERVTLISGGREHKMHENWNHGSFSPHNPCNETGWGYSASGRAESPWNIAHFLTPVHVSSDIRIELNTPLNTHDRVSFRLYNEYFDELVGWSDSPLQEILSSEPGTYFLGVFASWTEEGTSTDWQTGEEIAGDSWNSFDFWAKIVIS
jgi:hypothetical protein